MLRLCLCELIDALDLLPFKQGDEVIIEVFRDGVIQQITGHACGARAACFRAIALARVGIGLHHTVYVSILEINGQPPQVGRSREQAIPTLRPASPVTEEPEEPEWKTHNDTVECLITPEELLDDAPEDVQETGGEKEEGAHE